MLLHRVFDHITHQAVIMCRELGCWPMGSRYYKRHVYDSDWDFFAEYSEELAETFRKAGWLWEPGRHYNHVGFFHRGRAGVLLVSNLRTQITWRRAMEPLLVLPKNLRPLLHWWFNETVQRMMLHGGIDQITKAAVDFCVQQGCWPMGSRYYRTNAPGADWDFFDEYSDDLKNKFIKDGWVVSPAPEPVSNAVCFLTKPGANVHVQLVADLKVQIMLRNCLKHWLIVFPKSHRYIVIWSFYTIIQQTLLTDDEFYKEPRNTDKTLNYSDFDFWR